MNDQTRQRLAWIKQWQTASPLLEEQAKSELRNMTKEQRQQQIAILLDLACEFRQPRMDDGLVKLNIALASIFKK